EFELGLDRLMFVAVDDVDDQGAILIGGRRIEIWNIVKPPALVLGNIHKQLQGFTFCVIGKELQRVIDGLQVQSGFVCKDRRDDVYQLRHIGDLDNVRMIDKGVEKSGHHQRVLEVVMLFEDTAATLLRAASPVPDVPFVPRDVNLAVAHAGERRVDDALGGLQAGGELHRVR